MKALAVKGLLIEARRDRRACLDKVYLLFIFIIVSFQVIVFINIIKYSLLSK